MPTEARIVYSKPGTIFHIYGWEKFRCRIETKERGFFKKKIMFRAIIEAYGYSKFQPSKSWNENFHKLDWVSDKSLAILRGNNYLTVLESMEPEEEFKEGEYI